MKSKTPLSIIQMALESLNSERGKNSSSRTIQTIEQAVQRTAGIVENLLDVASADPEADATAELDRCLHQVIQIAQPALEKKGITLTWAKTPHPITIQMPKQKLKQALLHLFLHVADSSTAGEQVKTTLSSHPSTSERLTVTYSGMGSTPGNKSARLDAFSSIRPIGKECSLRLQMSRTIAEMYGGELLINRDVKHNFTIELTLPAKKGND